MPKRVLVPIANGTEEIEAVCIIDTLRRAEYDVTVASVEESLQVTCSRQTRLVADARIADCLEQDFDLIACPGGMPGAQHLRDSSPLRDLLKKQAVLGKLYAAICAAPVEVLQFHGLLIEKKATCFPSYIPDLHNAECAHERVVVDGNCITSQGAGTAIEFALALITALSGAEKAYEVGKRMIVLGYD